MGIIDLFVAVLGTMEVFIVATVGLGIILFPIALFIFWKWPHIYEACRSYGFNETPYQIKEFGEWAGFKNERKAKIDTRFL